MEGRSILAVSFLSVKFPSRAPAGTVLMRVFVGGATQPDLFDLDDAELKTLVRNEMGLLLGAIGRAVVDRGRPARPGDAAIHARASGPGRGDPPQRSARHSRLVLAGNAFDGVGIPDCVRSGQDAAEAMLSALADPAAPAAA